MNRAQCRLILSLAVAAMLLCPSCKKRERIISTLEITVTPASAAVSKDGTCTFTASGRDVRGEVEIDPVWAISLPIGSFSPSQGSQVTFTATGSGTAQITATDKGVSGNASVTVLSAYTVYDDSFNSDLSAPGAFQDVGCSIGLSADTLFKSQGSQSFKSTYTVTAGGWAGWYVSAPGVKDMSAYGSGYIKFDIRADADIQIGFRSDNIPSGTNTAKKYISQYGITPNGSVFQAVSIPVADLVAAQAGTDISQMKDLFIAAAIGSQIGARTNADFWIDNIRWTRD